ncbi:hypothetical protein ACFPN7_23480 [Amycolatopsis halotolerans]
MELNPDDETLLELGRFTWIGLHLEAAILRVCYAISPQVIPSGTVDQYVTLARQTLKHWAESDAHTSAARWLDEAQNVLDEERNQVLHATPELVLDKTIMTASRALGVQPRPDKRNRPGRLGRRRPFEPEHLRAAYARMALVCEGWENAHFQVALARAHAEGFFDGGSANLPGIPR